MASSIINFVDSMDALLSGADSLFIVGSPQQLQVRRHYLGTQLLPREPAA